MPGLHHLDQRSISNLAISQTAASPAGALQILTCTNAQINNAKISLAGGNPESAALEIGGGSSAGVALNVSLNNIAIRDADSSPGDDYVRYQTGPCAPKNVTVSGSVSTASLSVALSRSN